MIETIDVLFDGEPLEDKGEGWTVINLKGTLVLEHGGDDGSQVDRLQREHGEMRRMLERLICAPEAQDPTEDLWQDAGDLLNRIDKQARAALSKLQDE